MVKSVAYVLTELGATENYPLKTLPTFSRLTEALRIEDFFPIPLNTSRSKNFTPPSSLLGFDLCLSPRMSRPCRAAYAVFPPSAISASPREPLACCFAC
jgi:hypothetical protein